MSNPLQEGLSIVGAAVEADSRGDYPQAIRLYEQALNYLGAAVQREPDPSRRQLIDSKVREYLARLDVLRKMVSARQRHQQPHQQPHQPQPRQPQQQPHQAYLKNPPIPTTTTTITTTATTTIQPPQPTSTPETKKADQVYWLVTEYASRFPAKSRSLQAALDLANEAQRQDKAGNFQDALDLYIDVADRLSLVMRGNDNQNMTKYLRETMESYISRAEKIRGLYPNLTIRLRPETSTKSSPQPSTSTTQTSTTQSSATQPNPQPKSGYPPPNIPKISSPVMTNPNINPNLPNPNLNPNPNINPNLNPNLPISSPHSSTPSMSRPQAPLPNMPYPNPSMSNPTFSSPNPTFSSPNPTFSSPNPVSPQPTPHNAPYETHGMVNSELDKIREMKSYHFPSAPSDSPFDLPPAGSGEIPERTRSPTFRDMSQHEMSQFDIGKYGPGTSGGNGKDKGGEEINVENCRVGRIDRRPMYLFARLDNNEIRGEQRLKLKVEIRNHSSVSTKTLRVTLRRFVRNLKLEGSGKSSLKTEKEVIKVNDYYQGSVFPLPAEADYKGVLEFEMPKVLVPTNLEHRGSFEREYEIKVECVIPLHRNLNVYIPVIVV